MKDKRVKKGTPVNKSLPSAVVSMMVIVFATVFLGGCASQPIEFSKHNACIQQTVNSFQTSSHENDNLNWNGYNTSSQNPPSAYSDGDWTVCAQWTLSDDKCPTSLASDSRWVGLQTGNSQSQKRWDKLIQAVTIFDCSVEHPHWQYCFEVFPSSLNECSDDPRIHPCATVTAWVTYHNGYYRLGILDKVLDVSYVLPEPKFADIILESAAYKTGLISSLTKFSTVTFSNCNVNGKPFFTSATEYDKQIVSNKPTTYNKVLSASSFSVSQLKSA